MRPDPAIDLDYALESLPNGVAAIAHEPVEIRGKTEEFLALMLVAVVRRVL